MASALVWRPVNVVDGCMGCGDLENTYQINISSGKSFEKLIPLSNSKVLYSYTNKMRKASQASQKKMQYGWENIFVLVTEIFL